MRPSWVKIIAVLAGVWLIVGGTMAWVRARKPTPEKIVAFVEAHPIESSDAATRARVIEQVAQQVNQLEYNERQRMNNSRRLEPFWNALTNPEKSHYLDLVLPTGFKQLMENLNKMEPQKRKRMIDKAVRDLTENAEENIPPEVDPALIRKIVDQGLKTFYSEATIEAKMDALPFLEALEKTVKWNR